MPVITALTAAVATLLPAMGAMAITGAGAGFAVGTWTVASFIVTTSLSLGLSYAAQALQRTQTSDSSESSASINAPEVVGNVKQATPSARLVLWECRFGGAMFFYKVVPPYLYVGFLYSVLPISEFTQLYTNDNAISFSSLPDNTIVSPLAVEGQPNYPGRLQVCVQRGSLNQGRNALIAADFPDLGEYFMTPGVANAMFKCDYGNDYDEFVELWGNVTIPDFEWVGRGVPLPDPRVPGHRIDFDASDPEDLFNAVSTWSESGNASLTAALWALLPYGINATPQRVGWDSVRGSADFDDESVDGERRHVAAGVVSLSDKPNVVMEAIFTANRGYSSQRAGRFHIYSSQPQEPIMTISDSMLIGGYKFRNLKAKKELVNIGHCQFVEPTRDYQDAEGIIRRTDLVRSDGEDYEQTVRFSLTPGYKRAERLLKGYIADIRLGKSLSHRLPMLCYGLREGMVIRRFSETGRYSAQDALYSVEEWQLADDHSGVSFSFSEYNSANSRSETIGGDAMTFEVDTAT